MAKLGSPVMAGLGAGFSLRPGRIVTVAPCCSADVQFCGCLDERRLFAKIMVNFVRVTCIYVGRRSIMERNTTLNLPDKLVSRAKAVPVGNLIRLAREAESRNASAS